jgi:hypothetical protein
MIMSTSGNGRNWWVQVDFTVIFVLALLVGIGWYVKSEYDQNVTRERVKLEIARKEREQKEEENRQEAMARQKLSLEENERKRKESLEYSRTQQAEREAKRSAAAAKEEERRLKELADYKAKKEQEEFARAKALRDAEEAARADAEARGAASLRTREQNIQFARDQYASANREIDDLNKRIEVMSPKMAAYKNKMDYAIKNNAQLKTQMDNYVSANRTAAGKAGGVQGSDYMADDIMKTASKNESVAKEYRDAANGLMSLQAEKETCNIALITAKTKKDNALLQLKNLGAELNAQSPAKTATPTDTAKPAAGNTVYVLKDGRKLVSVNAVDAGDSITIKTASGKFETINKEDIDKTIQD